MTAAAVLLATVAVTAAGLDVPVSAYLAAWRAGDVGTVAGRAYAERRKPDAADIPLAGAAVVLLPRSDTLLARLEALRRGARDSPKSFREAAAVMRTAREDFERRLRDADGGDLVRSTVVDGDGAFRFADVPAGRWLLFVSHGTYHAHRGPSASAKDRTRYARGTRVVGFAATLVWQREVTVTRGGQLRFDLTDRNFWFSGVVETRERDADR